MVIGYLSAHAVTTLDYILRRHLNAAESKALLTTLLQKIQVAAVNQAIIQQALQEDFTDFEYAVCHAAAEATQADIIVTRNIKDFEHSRLPVMMPAEFCEHVNQAGK